MNAPTPLLDPRSSAGPAGRMIAWVDGVGAFLLCLGERTTLGGLSGRSDVRLSSDLAADHAAIVRSGEGYVVEASGPAIVAQSPVGRAGGVSPPRTNRFHSHGSGRVVDGRTDLVHNDELVLFREGGGAVRLTFRRPNPLTATATLAIVSEHRTEPRYDAVVLLAEACVLGPAGDAHIRCRDWEQSVLMFRRDGELWCKSERSLVVGGRKTNGPVPVAAGDHISSEDVSFRLEDV